VSRMALFSPTPATTPCGNNATLRRIARGLRDLGHEVMEASLDSLHAGEDSTREPLQGFDLLHAFHAFKTGVAVREAALALGIPYVVSITGTDLHEDLARPERRDAVLSVLRDAGAILVASEEAARKVSELPSVTAPCVVVPKGVAPSPAAPAPSPGRILFLHVASWREVKNNFFPLEPLARLAAEVPTLELLYLGPVLEERYWEPWRRLAAAHPFARHGGCVEPGHMAAMYARAAVVLNTSHSEGGANSILEAMAAGKAVLASDVRGNASLIHHDESCWEESTGVLYRTRRLPEAQAPATGPERRVHDPEDFLAKARRLATDEDLRFKIGSNARRFVLEHHSLEREIEKVIESYRLAGVDPSRSPR
jgi:glycosyltransferase involved in cell wall biosynthesis